MLFCIAISGKSHIYGVLLRVWTAHVTNPVLFLFDMKSHSFVKILLPFA